MIAVTCGYRRGGNFQCRYNGEENEYPFRELGEFQGTLVAVAEADGDSRERFGLAAPLGLGEMIARFCGKLKERAPVA